MPALKVTSFFQVKESDIPKREANTAMKEVADAVLAELKKRTGESAVGTTVQNSGKYTRYALQKRLQKSGAKVVVRAGKEKGQFIIVRVS